MTLLLGEDHRQVIWKTCYSGNKYHATVGWFMLVSLGKILNGIGLSVSIKPLSHGFVARFSSFVVLIQDLYGLIQMKIK